MKKICDLHGRPVSVFALLMLACLWPCAAGAEIRTTDDAGNRVRLDQPARRIVSLAPHITELLFAAGAGEYVVGVSAFSDFPPAARRLPRVGSGASLDLERIVALRPDLVVAWESGNPAIQVERLRSLGMTVFVSEPRSLEDVATTLARLAGLAATRTGGQGAIDAFSRRLAALREQNTGKKPVRIFYQVWDRPLMTVNGDHIISDVIRLCGGINVFSDLSQLAPQIGIEAVLQQDPQVIITAASDGEHGNVPGDWQRWSWLSAVRQGHLYAIPGDVLVRHSPRILEGADQVCEILDRVRESGVQERRRE